MAKRRIQSTALFEKEALANPNIAMIETDQPMIPIDMVEVFVSAAFGLVVGIFFGACAYGLFWGVSYWAPSLERMTWAAALVLGGFSAAIVAVWRQWEADRARNTNRHAKFHEPIEQPAGLLISNPDTLPNTRQRHRLWVSRRQLVQFANLLPETGWNMTYDQWTGTGKVFSRNQFRDLRVVLNRLKYIIMDEHNQVTGFTELGRGKVTRWQNAEFDQDIIEFLGCYPLCSSVLCCVHVCNGYRILDTRIESGGIIPHPIGDRDELRCRTWG
jgi:hypothetical protein